MIMQSASEAINNAPVICNYCFTKASEQDGDIMCCVFTAACRRSIIALDLNHSPIRSIFKL